MAETQKSLDEFKSLKKRKRELTEELTRFNSSIKEHQDVFKEMEKIAQEAKEEEAEG